MSRAVDRSIAHVAKALGDQTSSAQFIVATRGRKVDGLACCIDQTCCSISRMLGTISHVNPRYTHVSVTMTMNIGFPMRG